MTEFVRIRTENTMETTVSRTWAEISGAEVIDSPAVDAHGKPLAESRKDGRPVLPRTSVDEAAALNSGQLRGKALDDELEKAGLPKSGTVSEKQDRLADHLAGASLLADDNTPEEAAE
jgi:hypothetical protein